jgi:hypothetical protein
MLISARKPEPAKLCAPHSKKGIILSLESGALARTLRRTKLGGTSNVKPNCFTPKSCHACAWTSVVKKRVDTRLSRKRAMAFI